MDKGKQFGAVYFDYSKAPDSVSHKLLLYTVETYEFNGILLNWFSNDLDGRKQQVVINGSSSQVVSVIPGVPQGSILGSMLFLISINDTDIIILYLLLYNYIIIFMYVDDKKVGQVIESVSVVYNFKIIQMIC